jgi:hypothetical protein
MLDFWHMKNWAWLSFTACGMGLLLCGCGGGSAPAVSPLTGNWLIVGPMPTNQLQLPPVTEGFRLAMTFDVTGNNIVAAGYANVPCQPPTSSPPPILTPISLSSAISATGTAASDGSFSVQSPANFPLGTISIHGNAPQTNEGEWPGSYAISVSLNPAVGSPCTANSSGTFTATSFPLIDGVYVGTGSSQSTVNGTGTPVTVQVTLKQGGTVVDQVTGKPFSSNLALSGSIRVQGIPCFTSGTMNPSPQSAVEGNQVVASFSMDDGSTLRITGALTDSTETRMTSLVSITAGQCGTVPHLFLPELDRQS